MTKQDERAVESMCKCGLDLSDVIAGFPGLNPAEVENVFLKVREIAGDIVKVPVLKVNCS